MSTRPAHVLLLALLLVCSLGRAEADEPTVAEPMARPMLYVAVGPEQTLFLLGTLHVPDTRVTAVSPLVDLAVSRCDELLGEVPFDEDVGTQMLSYIRLPRNRSLKQMLGDALWLRTEALMSPRGQSLEDWDHVKPWIVDTHIGELFAPAATRDTRTLDEAVYARAKAKGKPVGGLETVYEQVRVFDALGFKEQVLLFEETVGRLEQDQRTGTNSVETMIRKYLSGDPEALLKEVETYFDFAIPRDRMLYDRLHAERNTRMLQRVSEMAAGEPGRTRMLVVGGAHLAGTQGMLAMLRAGGHVVWRATKAADVPASREASVLSALERARVANRALSKRVGELETRVEDLEAQVPKRARPNRRRRCCPKTCERRKR